MLTIEAEFFVKRRTGKLIADWDRGKEAHVHWNSAARCERWETRSTQNVMITHWTRSPWNNSSKERFLVKSIGFNKGIWDSLILVNVLTLRSEGSAVWCLETWNSSQECLFLQNEIILLEQRSDYCIFPSRQQQQQEYLWWKWNTSLVYIKLYT